MPHCRFSRVSKSNPTGCPSQFSGKKPGRQLTPNSISDTFPRQFSISRYTGARRARRKQELLPTLHGTSRRLTPIDWIICAVACVGFAFDTYELLVLTLTVQPALTEFLAAKPGSAEFNRWIGLMFYVPAIAGGVFGLLGGYLIDRFGRRRVLFWSILLFCSSALATGYSLQRPAIAVLPLRHVCGRLRRVRRRHGVAGRNVSASASSGKRFSASRKYSRPPAAS